LIRKVVKQIEAHFDRAVGGRLWHGFAVRTASGASSTIGSTGDYHWRKDAGLRNRKLRPLRVSKPA